METYFSEEADKKLLEAKSVEEVLAIANEYSTSPVSKELAEKIFAKIKVIRREDAELILMNWSQSQAARVFRSIS